MQSDCICPVGHRTDTRSISNWNYEIQDRPFKETISNEGKKYKFTGTYGPSLLEEVVRYSEVAAAIGLQYNFDVIHAHDWITYLAGIEAKKISGKPLIVHVHATEYEWKILQHFPDAHFIMAGSGDLLPKMIEMVAVLKMSDRFILLVL